MSEFRQIVVTNCIDCPLSRLRRIKDGPFCGSDKLKAYINVKGYDDSVHPECPLEIVEGDI